MNLELNHSQARYTSGLFLNGRERQEMGREKWRTGNGKWVMAAEMVDAFIYLYRHFWKWEKPFRVTLPNNS